MVMTPTAHYRLVQNTSDLPRFGEGSLVSLSDGDIFGIWSRFSGTADHDAADLYGGRLDLDDGTLSDERIFFPSAEALNQMSTSLERLHDDSIGMVFIRKLTANKDEIWFSRSTDDGITWSAHVKVNASIDDEYLVVNNDRLRQLSSGRLILPVAIYPDGDYRPTGVPCCVAAFLSDDNGASWYLSQRLRIEDENKLPPHRLLPEHQEAWLGACRYAHNVQEPGVEELTDDRILLYARTTLGYMYRTWSEDGGLTWAPLTAATDLVSCCSPQSIRRLPQSSRLLCIYNNRRGVGYNEPEWNWRTTLSAAVSDDGGESWQTLAPIEDDSHNQCYTSILFHQDQVVLTYYESENTGSQRRNLAALKLQALPLQAFRA